MAPSAYPSAPHLHICLICIFNRSSFAYVNMCRSVCKLASFLCPWNKCALLVCGKASGWLHGALRCKLVPACGERRDASLSWGALAGPSSVVWPTMFCSMVRERGVWSHKFIFVHAFLIKRKSECLWFNCFGASIEFLMVVPDRWAWKIASYLVTSYLGNSHVHTQILT